MKSNILNKLFNILAILVFIIITLIFLISNNYIWLILYLIFTYFISKNEKIKHFSILIFVTSFIIRLLLVTLVNLPQIYDFKILLDASNMFSNGDYSFNEWFHFRVWSYQTGFVIYQGIILKLFKSEVLLKILNALYSSILVVIIYKISSKISNERSAKIVSLLYMVFPFHIITNLTLFNHHLSTLLMYIGIIFLLKENKKLKDYIISSIFIAFGNIIRPEGIIVVFSLIVFTILTFDKTKLKSTLINIFTFIFIYFLINTSASMLIIKTGINPNGLANNDPLWKFVLGFNSKTCGYYNNEDDVRIFVNHEDEKEIIKYRVMSKETGKLMVCKVESFWLNSGLYLNEGQFYNKQINIKNIKINIGKIEDIVMAFNQGIQSLVVLLMVFGLFINRKSIENKYLFLLILTVVTFSVYLLIEMQARYSYFIFISVFILSSKSIEYILNKIGK